MTSHNLLHPHTPSSPLSRLQSSSLPSLNKSTPDLSDSENSKKAGKWTSEEDELLRKYVSLYSEKQWKKISEHIPGRTSIQCLHRWTKILKPGLVKGPWTQEEDQKLLAWIKKHGPGKWAQAASLIPGRSGKQCRERWSNNLNPDVKKGNWSTEEDELIFELYQKHGSSWSKIAKYMPGRTENSIKNRFYSTLRKLAASKNKTTPGSVGSDERSNASNAESRQEDLMITQEEEPIAKKGLEPLLARNSNVKETPKKEEAKKPVVMSSSEENGKGKVPEALVEQQRILNTLMASLKVQPELGLALPLLQQNDLYRDLLQNQMKLSVPSQIAPLSARVNQGIKPFNMTQNYQSIAKPQGLGLFGDNGNIEVLIGSVSGNIMTASLIYNHYLESINEIVKNNEGNSNEEAKERVTVMLKQLFALEGWLNNAKLELIRLQSLQSQNYLAQLPLESSLLNKRKFVDENEEQLIKKRKVE